MSELVYLLIGHNWSWVIQDESDSRKPIKGNKFLADFDGGILRYPLKFYAFSAIESETSQNNPGKVHHILYVDKGLRNFETPRSENLLGSDTACVSK